MSPWKGGGGYILTLVPSSVGEGSHHDIYYYKLVFHPLFQSRLQTMAHLKGSISHEPLGMTDDPRPITTVHLKLLSPYQTELRQQFEPMSDQLNVS